MYLGSALAIDMTDRLDYHHKYFPAMVDRQSAPLSMIPMGLRSILQETCRLPIKPTIEFEGLGRTG